MQVSAEICSEPLGHVTTHSESSCDPPPPFLAREFVAKLSQGFFKAFKRFIVMFSRDQPYAFHAR
jgi:hypothetical protein